jgi:death-on-curing protein
MDITWLDGETVVRLNEVALYEGEPRGRNPGSDLEGALARPRAHYHYGGVESLTELAALYAIALTKAHAFQDGNKRTALLAVRAFLKANGMEFDYGPHEKEAVEMMQDIATDEAGHEEMADWIDRNSTRTSDVGTS